MLFSLAYELPTAQDAPQRSFANKPETIDTVQYDTTVYIPGRAYTVFVTRTATEGRHAAGDRRETGARRSTR